MFNRVINLVSDARLNEDIIWKHVKEIKADLPMEDCHYLRNKTIIIENFQKLSKLLNVSDDFDKVKNLSRDVMKKGANIFIFLNSCPATKAESKDLKMLYSFFINIEPWNPTISGMILYTLNHMKKAPQDSRMISQKLLKYFASKLGFQYILPDDVEKILIQEVDIPRKLSSVHDKNLFHTLTNHPVHILDRDKNHSPSSLIPFCACLW